MEIIGFIVVLLFYFLPTFLGWNKKNSGAIIILNLLLGWTLIGWIVALIWSLTADTPDVNVIIVEKTKEKKQKKVEEEKTYTKEELQKMLDNMKD